MEPFPLRVLVAEDGSDTLEVLVAGPDGAGIEIVGVASGATEAVEVARRTVPDVALIDVRVPGGGVSATEGIIRSVEGCHVLALSEHENRGAILQMLLAGAVGYVVKGTPGDEVRAIVRRASLAEAGLSVDVMTGLMMDLLREIADRSESEAEARRSEERFRGLVEAAPDAVVIVDQQGQIVLVNEQTELMFGYERRELLGKRVEFLLPERFHREHHQHRLRYSSAPRTRRMGTVRDLTGRRMNGREFPVDVSLSTLETDEGILVIAFVRDMSERERAVHAAGVAGEVRGRAEADHAG